MTCCAEIIPLTRLGEAGSAYTYSVPSELQAALRVGHLVEIPFRATAIRGVVACVGRVCDPDRPLRPIGGLADPIPVLLPYQLELARWVGSEYRAPLADVIGAMVPAGVAGRGRSKIGGNSRAAPKTVQHDARRVPGHPFRSGPKLSEAQSVAVQTILSALNDCCGAHGETTEGDHPGDHEADGRPAGPVFLLHGVTGSGKTEVYMSVIEAVIEHGGAALALVPEIALTPQAVQRFTERFPERVAALHSRLSPGRRRKEWLRVRNGEATIVIGPRSAIFAPLERLGVIVLDEEHDASYKQGESPRYHAREVAIHLGKILKIPVILGSATPDVASYYAGRKGDYQLLRLPNRPVWEEAAPVVSLAARGPDRSRIATNPASAPEVTGKSDLAASVSSSPSVMSSEAQSVVREAAVDHGRIGFNDPNAIRSMPPVAIVDLRQELKSGNGCIFSRQLQSAMLQALDQGQQVVLFINRRGHATAVLCRDCGQVASCPRCDIPLTYHSVNLRLICHRCNLRRPAPDRCGLCSSSRIQHLGVGTQQVVEETARLVPNARILRWDRDVAQGYAAHQAILDDFGEHEADVLVGTQMIAKGLDFPLISVVGVIAADVGLHLPDIRAAERCFQLMTQVAGRAGRARLPSQVIIQTYSPDHYALLAARNHDYWSFYVQEMTFRRRMRYPPFSRFVRLLVRARDPNLAQRQARQVGETLQAAIRERKLAGLDILGPAPAFATKVEGRYQWHLVLRGRKVHDVLDVVPNGVVVDVDPVDLL